MSSGRGSISFTQKTLPRVCASSVVRVSNSRPISTGVRGRGAQNDLGFGGDVLRRPKQVDDSFLPGDAPYEHHDGVGGVDAPADQGSGAADRPVVVRVDPVVDHKNPLRFDRRVT